MISNVIRMGHYFGKGIRLMVGMPDYSTYVAHMMNRHPEQPVMSYQEFFRERQEARFGGKVGRCC